MRLGVQAGDGSGVHAPAGWLLNCGSEKRRGGGLHRPAGEGGPKDACATLAMGQCTRWMVRLRCTFACPRPKGRCHKAPPHPSPSTLPPASHGPTRRSHVQPAPQHPPTYSPSWCPSPVRAAARAQARPDNDGGQEPDAPQADPAGARTRA